MRRVEGGGFCRGNETLAVRPEKQRTSQKRARWSPQAFRRAARCRCDHSSAQGLGLRLCLVKAAPKRQNQFLRASEQMLVFRCRKLERASHAGELWWEGISQLHANPRQAQRNSSWPEGGQASSNRVLHRSLILGCQRTEPCQVPTRCKSHYKVDVETGKVPCVVYSTVKDGSLLLSLLGCVGGWVDWWGGRGGVLAIYILYQKDQSYSQKQKSFETAASRAGKPSSAEACAPSARSAVVTWFKGCWIPSREPCFLTRSLRVTSI